MERQKGLRGFEWWDLTEARLDRREGGARNMIDQLLSGQISENPMGDQKNEERTTASRANLERLSPKKKLRRG